MTEETPAKVMSLMGAAMFSMFLLFAVSTSNASFAKAEYPLPDVFSPTNVVSALDNLSNSYSKLVESELIQPGLNSYAIAQYNLGYVIDEASPYIVAIAGLERFVSPQESLPQVAGAYTQTAQEVVYEPMGLSFSVDDIYTLVVR